MNCAIIKDLLPSYIDGLTSQESNAEIENHLQECATCHEMYKQMQSNIDSSEVSQHKAIDPLKKFKKKFRYGIILSVVSTFIVCVMVISGYNFLFNNGWQSHSDNVAISYSYSGEEIRFDVSLTDDKRLDMRGNRMENGGAELVLSEILYAPFSEHYPANEGKYSEKTFVIPCVDENGNPIEFSDDSNVVFKCSDKEIIYSLKEIFKELKTGK